MDCFCLCQIHRKRDAPFTIMLSLVRSTLCCLPRMLSVELRCARRKSSVLKDRLELHFNKIMKRDDIPLLSNFDVFKNSLPVRRDSSTGEHIPLYELPHWTCNNDMLAYQLGEQPLTSRAVVKYLSAPGGSGKTSCILPAFLKNAEKKVGGFTHYLYLSFDNNAYKYFRLDHNDRVTWDLAEDQGAWFILECLKILLEKPDQMGPYKIPCNKEPLPIRSTVMEYLKRIIPRPDQKLLVHVDEHHKMCRRDGEGDVARNGALFSKGAMSVLACVPRVTVVATYTARPPLPPQGSSAVCRYPLALPCLDIYEATKFVEELRFPHSHDSFNREQKRLWVTLCFRLGMKLTEIGLLLLHKRGDENTNNLLQEFEERASHADATEALKKCIQLCTICDVKATEENKNAARLLLGIPEKNIEPIERQVSNIFIVDGSVSCSLMHLLTMEDPEYKVYSVGRRRFMHMLTAQDYLSHTPLESAYNWSLSCLSAVKESLTFLNDSTEYMIKCKRLLPGRLFPTIETDTYDLSFMKPDTIYFAAERDGLPTHPLADMFFCTKDGQLVLIDIAGGKNIEEKKNKLTLWIKREQDKVKDKLPKWTEWEERFPLHGVVLAPLATGVSMTCDGVQVVCGEDAQKLLHGLRQVFLWLK